MTHQPMDQIVLDQMYEHPERFGHMSKDEYLKLQIEDIRWYHARLTALETLLMSPPIGASDAELLAGARGFLRASR